MRAKGGSEETVEKNVTSGRSEGTSLKSVQDKSTVLWDGPGANDALPAEFEFHVCVWAWLGGGGVGLKVGDNLRVTLMTATFLSKIAHPFSCNSLICEKAKSSTFSHDRIFVVTPQFSLCQERKEVPTGGGGDRHMEKQQGNLPRGASPLFWLLPSFQTERTPSRDSPASCHFSPALCPTLEIGIFFLKKNV